MEIERRLFLMDGMKVERAKPEKPEIVGHAAVFNREANIGGWFIEEVAPGAFKRAILEDDVRSLFNHNPDYILGRNRAGTLKLSEDDTGLMTVTMPPDTSVARDLMVSIERGDVSQMSFGFRVRKQEWDETGDILKRRILEVELFDVSPVTFPAYAQTDVGLRSALAGAPKSVAERLGVKPPSQDTIIHLHGETFSREHLREALKVINENVAGGLNTVNAGALVRRQKLQKLRSRGE